MGFRDILSQMGAVGSKMMEELRIHRCYVVVFNTPEGREVLKHLARKCHLSSPTFVRGDERESAFREGQRHVILSILRYLNKDHDQIINHIEEGLQDANHEDIIGSRSGR